MLFSVWSTKSLLLWKFQLFNVFSFCAKSSFLCELDKKIIPRISSDVHEKTSISSFFWKKHWKSIFFNKSTNTKRKKEWNFLLKMFAIKAIALKYFLLNSHSTEMKTLSCFYGGHLKITFILKNWDFFWKVIGFKKFYGKSYSCRSLKPHIKRHLSTTLSEIFFSSFCPRVNGAVNWSMKIVAFIIVLLLFWWNSKQSLFVDKRIIN